MSDSSPKNPWERLSNSVLVRFLLLFASGWALVQLLAYFETVIVVFTFAAVLAFLLSYPVQWLHRFLPHGVAVILVFLLSFVVLGGLMITVGLAVLSQGQQLLDSMTAFINSLTPLIEQLEVFLRNRNLPVNLNAIQEQVRNQALSGIVSSLVVIQSIFTNLVTFIFIAVIAFFLLLDGERLWDLMLKLIPQQARNRFAVVTKRKFLGFFRGQLLLALFLTTSTLVVFLILKVPFALVLALIIAVLDLIPGIGATLGVSTITLLVLSQSVWLALKVLVACIILQQIQDNLIAPRVMQGTLNLNPVVVFFALLVGARIAGLLGIFIAIPIAGVVVALFEIDEMKAES